MSRRSNNKQVVFISGIFNVLHPGHIRMFRFAAELGSKLVIGLQKSSHSTFQMLEDEERREALSMISLVDEVIMMEDVISLLQEVQPNIVVKGKEFQHKFNIEDEYLKTWGGRLLFNSGETQSGSVKYLNGNGHQNHLPTPQSYRRFCARHEISGDEMLAFLNKVPGLRVAVVGDIIVDEYVECDPVGLSREDPTVVVKPLNSQHFVGGAAIVAQHAKAFGCHVDFLSVAGNDEKADLVQAQLDEQGIAACIFRDDSRPTTSKKRYRAHNKTLLRVNDYRSHSLESDIAHQFIQAFDKVTDRCDLVIFSDFSYGLLNHEMVSDLRALCRQKSVLAVADSQTSSQRGDLSKFVDLNLVTPTEIEARLATNILDNDVGLAEVIKNVNKQLQVSNVIITLSADGALILDGANPENPNLDSLPAFNKYPVDVSGAGDLLLVSAALLLTAGASLWHAAALGMIASGIHISHVGNTPIAVDELKAIVTKL